MLLLRRLLFCAILLLVLTAVGSGAIIWHTYDTSSPYRYSTAETVPERPVGLVFGAAVNPDHTLSPILQDRVDGAVSLYAAGRVKKLLMTGDNSTVYYNEVVAMKEYAVSKGVPASNISLDYAGFDTYDSCYRARHIFNVTAAILVTQSYHLPRALTVCRTLGIDAVGLGLSDWEKYPDLRVPYTTREYGADIKAWWQLNVTHPTSKFLGQQETL